jgi:predicted GNAT family N-acyltransferase
MGSSMIQIALKIIDHGSPEYEKAVSLREEILRKPLGLTFSQEEREKEKQSIQIAGFYNQELISTAVLLLEGPFCKMQRVVVKQTLQNAGVGSKMLTFCELHAAGLGGCALMYCHARSSAVNFYLKNGYVSEGDAFDEDTIPHLKMQKLL